ncbi:MAG: Glu/Leu/Phe/Val dehydrogenase, partial [Candidatus Lambdaproteobacteria bacterium]|nr:Glu/Leu/Phe/Val dehydrogenase [Candidatus Lambdaproteobacteria bacterium]
MNDSLQFADEFGPARVIQLYNPGSGLRAVLVVDNVAIGPAIGGIRMAPDVSAQEAFRLARAMTLKNAAAGLPHGGGKAVIFADPRMPAHEKERLVRDFAAGIAEVRDYIPGPDMGTDERCMAWIRDEIGRAVGLPRAQGGIPLDEIGATGWGLLHAIDAALPFCDLTLEGARVVIQGFGAVGRHAARFLAERGARVVGVANTAGSLHAPDGLDVQAVDAWLGEGRSLNEFPGVQHGSREAVIDMPCEIWIPAARPDVVTRD